VTDRFGWRAYAIPFLIAATVFTVADITGTGRTASTGATAGSAAAIGGGVAPAATSAAVSTVLPATTEASAVEVTSYVEPPVVGTDSDDVVGATVADPSIQVAANLAPGALPAGGEFGVSGDGTFRVIPGAGPQIGSAETVKTYTIEVENGVTIEGGDAAFAGFVDATLSDPRSWPTLRGVSLRRLEAGAAEPDFRITLTSQMTERGICGYDVELESSCYNGAVGRVVLNDARWVRGALSYSGDLTAYHQYAINHEVGHALGYGHQPCETNGDPAPVMMQQSWSTSNDALAAINGSVTADGKVCTPNPWPDPQGGAEGQATATTR
jgi:hypothetical protein